jgi:hypothetical protein
MENETVQALLAITTILISIVAQSYAVFKISRSKALSGSSKILWMIIVFITPLLGAGIYLIQQNKNHKLRNKRMKGIFDSGRLRT